VPMQPGQGGSALETAAESKARRAVGAASPVPRRAVARKHVILFLAANPSDTGHLALDREAHAIHVEVKRSGHRDRFEFVTRCAVEPLDLLRELRELKPTIVHFSGHGARPAAITDRTQGRELVADAAPSEDDPGGLLFDSAAGRGQVAHLPRGSRLCGVLVG